MKISYLIVDFELAYVLTKVNESFPCLTQMLYENWYKPYSVPGTIKLIKKTRNLYEKRNSEK